jgi:hypothetical protein
LFQAGSARNTERIEPSHLEAGKPGWIDWDAWREKLKDRPGQG